MEYEVGKIYYFRKVGASGLARAEFERFRDGSACIKFPGAGITGFEDHPDAWRSALEHLEKHKFELDPDTPPHKSDFQERLERELEKRKGR